MLGRCVEGRPVAVVIWRPTCNGGVPAGRKDQCSHTTLFFQRECVCIHVGQAGIQMGTTMWELFCIEHGIAPDGTMLKPPSASNSKSADSAQTFFKLTEDKMIPRMVMVDLEPSILGKLHIFLLLFFQRVSEQGNFGVCRPSTCVIFYIFCVFAIVYLRSAFAVSQIPYSCDSRELFNCFMIR